MGFQDEVDHTGFVVRAEGTATCFGDEVLSSEAGVFDEGEPFLLEQVDEADWFGFLVTFAASWSGEDFAPLPGQATTTFPVVV